MDYSKLSDKEINKQVAFALGCKEVMPDIFMDDNRRYEFDKPKKRSDNQFYFDPCNKPADAWPIISGHHISIMYVEALSKWCAGNPYWVDGCEWQLDIDVVDENPLRAAMIIFLMMQDSRK